VNLTNEDVQQILELLEASSFNELKLTTDRFKLTLRRSGAGEWTQDRQTLSTPRVAPATRGAASAAPAPAAPRAAAIQDPLGEAAPLELDHARASRAQWGVPIEIHPPLMGTFYRAPQPGAPPFVEVGAQVNEDTVIGIVETMKLMNSVYAGTRGEVIEICAANGQLVEQHDVLMRLKPG